MTPDRNALLLTSPLKYTKEIIDRYYVMLIYATPTLLNL